MDHRETVSLFWINPTNKRYYSLSYQQDLLADWILTRTNGALGTKLGQVKQLVCNNYQEGLKFIEETKKKRAKRGYELQTIEPT